MHISDGMTLCQLTDQYIMTVKTVTIQSDIPLAADALKLAKANMPSKQDEAAREQQEWFDKFVQHIPGTIQHGINNGWTGIRKDIGSRKFTKKQYSHIKGMLEPMGYRVYMDSTLGSTCNEQRRWHNNLVISFYGSKSRCTIL